MTNYDRRNVRPGWGVGLWVVIPLYSSLIWAKYFVILCQRYAIFLPITVLYIQHLHQISVRFWGVFKNLLSTPTSEVLV